MIKGLRSATTLRLLFTCSVLMSSAILSLDSSAFAQKVTNTVEGTGGHRDSRRRGPVLSVSHEPYQGGTRILADAHVPNEDYTIFPIRFEFYVNRKLISTQIRSPELPGPVGITVGKDVATTPFNYAVIATVLHPNLSFPTVLNGAAFDGNLFATLDCTLTFEPNSTDQAVYVGSKVGTVQTGNSSVSLQFLASDAASSQSIQVETDLTFNSSGKASATTKLTRNGLVTSYAMSGSATTSTQASDSTSLSLVDIASSDGAVTLTCQ